MHDEAMRRKTMVEYTFSLADKVARKSNKPSFLSPLLMIRYAAAVAKSSGSSCFSERLLLLFHDYLTQAFVEKQEPRVQIVRTKTISRRAYS